MAKSRPAKYGIAQLAMGCKIYEDFVLKLKL